MLIESCMTQGSAKNFAYTFSVEPVLMMAAGWSMDVVSPVAGTLHKCREPSSQPET